MLKLRHKGYIIPSVIHIINIEPNVVLLRLRPSVSPPPSPLSLLCGLVLCFVWPPPRVRWVCITKTSLNTPASLVTSCVCASSVRLWLQDLVCLCFEALASVTLSVSLRLFQVPVISLFLLTRSNQFNQRHSVSGLLSPCIYIFSAPVRKDSEALLCVLDDQISSVSSSLDVLMVF